MSRLPNAPLQEVSAQLRWHLKPEDFKSYGFFAGDYYQSIKKNYSEREVITPDGLPIHFMLNNPTHKFLKPESEYPFIILGPGIVALNVNDEHYFWKDFKKQIKFAFRPIFEIVPKLSTFDHTHISLEYIDFFEFDFNERNIYSFLSESLNTNFHQSFIQEKPNNLNLNLSYESDRLGSIKFTYNKGKIKGKNEGLIIRTTIDSGVFDSDLKLTLDWFDSAHKKCSSLFKEMTKGKLYESFK